MPGNTVTRPQRRQPQQQQPRPQQRPPGDEPGEQTCNELPELLTAAEAALLLHVSLRTLQRMKAAGKIGYVELDTGAARPSVRYTRGDVAACLRAARHVGQAASA